MANNLSANISQLIRTEMESGDGNGNPINSVSHSGYTKSDETKFKDAVFKHVSAGSNTIEPQSLVGILSDSVGTPLNGFNSRLSWVEVKLDLILTKLIAIRQMRPVRNAMIGLRNAKIPW